MVRQRPVANGHLMDTDVVEQSNGFAKKSTSNGKASTYNDEDDAESWIQQTCSRTVAPALILTIMPNVVVLMWYVAVRCDGSVLQLRDQFVDDGVLPVLGRMWTSIHIASPASVALIVGYMLWALLLMVTLPGKLVDGPVTPNGNVPVYRDNGFKCYVVTMAAFVVLQIGLRRYTSYSVTLVYDHFDEFIGTITIFSYVLCLFLYIKGLYFPSSSDCGSTGNPIFDYYWGTELHPRVCGVDIKVFTNCRYGMTVWPLLVATFALKSYELHGFVDSVWVSATLQMIYFTKFFWWESGYMRTIDIALDRAGYYICWGCLCYVPGIYASVSMYLASRSIHLGPFWSSVILVLGVASCLINYDADRQKLEVRQTDGDCLVWGRRPEVIRAEYQVAGGETRTSLLLVSGYWGISRHFHYVPELALAFLWTVPALFDNVIQYTYLFSLFCVLVHRTYRDDAKCREKYRHHWAEYCRRVPYKILPYVF